MFRQFSRVQKPSTIRAALALVDALESRTLLSTVPAFNTATTYPVGKGPIAIASADLNGDGFTDLVVADQTATDVRVLLNRGDGTFTAGPIIALSQAPMQILTGDFNADGRIDIATVNVGGASPGPSVSIILQEADHTFALPQSTTFDSGITGNVSFAAGDFNSDGKLDIVAVDSSHAGVFFLAGNGNGTFQSPVSFSTSLEATQVVAGDFNGDGKLDIAALTHAAGTSTSSGYFVSQLLGDGTGNLNDIGNDVSVPGGSPQTNGSGPMITGNFDSDSLPDLAIGTDSGVAVLTSASAQSAPFISSGIVLNGAVRALTAGDFNFDGKTDLAATVTSDATVIPLINDGTATFVAGTALSTGTQPLALTQGAFAPGGKLSLASANFASNNVSVFLNTTAGTVPTRTSTTVVSSASPSPFGADLQLTATIAPGSGPSASQNPTGTVRFYDGSHLLGSAAITVGTRTAVFTVNSLEVGNHSIVAKYAGDGLFLASSSTAIVQNISPTSTHGPDLIGAITLNTLPGVFVPGDRGGVRLLVTNNGNALGSGVIFNQLYLSTSGTVDAASIPLTVRGSFVRSAVRLLPGRSRLLSGVFVVPRNLPAGFYQLLAVVDATGSLPESDSSNNTTVGATQQAVTKFGALGSRVRVPLTLASSDGTLTTYQLIGPGTGSVLRNGDEVNLVLTGTTSTSRLYVTARGGSRSVNLALLSSDGPMQYIYAPQATLGNLTLAGGVARLVVGRTADAGVWHINGDLGILNVNGIGPAVAPAQSAPNTFSATIAGTLGRLLDRGSLIADLAAANIGVFYATGAVSAAHVLAGANFGADGILGGGDDTFVAGSIKQLRIGGPVTNSVFAAGLQGASGASPFNTDGTIAAGASVAGGAALSAVYVARAVDDVSRFLADVLPIKARLGVGVLVANDPRFHL